MPWPFNSLTVACEQHLGVSLTMGITMSRHFTTNRFDRDCAGACARKVTNSTNIDKCYRDTYKDGHKCGPCVFSLSSAECKFFFSCVQFTHMWSEVYSKIV